MFQANNSQAKHLKNSNRYQTWKKKLSEKSKFLQTHYRICVKLSRLKEYNIIDLGVKSGCFSGRKKTYTGET